MNTLIAVRMERMDITPHGFRSSFRDWTADTEACASDVAEFCLAHVKRGVEGAYMRTSMLSQRAEVMQEWGRFCTSSLA